MLEIKQISVANDFSAFPAGRDLSDGPFTGELFRTTILAPAFESKDYKLIEVDLDGTMGYGSSFLEEAFGGLVRVNGLTQEDLKNRLKIKDSRKIYEYVVWQYIEEEAKRLKR